MAFVFVLVRLRETGLGCACGLGSISVTASIVRNVVVAGCALGALIAIGSESEPPLRISMILASAVLALFVQVMIRRNSARSDASIGATP